MDKPILLDLYCKAGGCTKGYMDAGFYVIGVDIEPQPHYIGDEFVQADALTFPLDGYSLIHASPVCKAYTNCNFSPKEKHHKGIHDIRQRLQTSGIPYVIENVMGAKAYMNACLMLCGSMFGLKVQRHRLFEIGNTDICLTPPLPCNHKGATIAIYGHSVWDSSLPGTPRKDGRSRPDSVPVTVGRAAMDIDWMSTAELAQAIPPAYTKFLGEQMLIHMGRLEKIA
jgi:DNA (cytosine-5)-methyltransferase 1